jgi:hypothetical protein
MARQYYGVEKGLRIYAENSDNNVIVFTGSGAPAATAEFNDAPIGSLYIREGSGELYQKAADTNSVGDWVLNGGADIGTWRPEKIRALSGDTGITSGVARDLTASPFSDDEGTQLSAADFAIGEYAIIDNVLYEVTDVSAPNVTFTTASPALSEGDTFLAINYLPDSPDSQEGQAIVTYNGSAMVKIGDIDWNFATGIELAAGYSAGSGDVTASDSVQSALEKIDGNNDAQDTLLGTTQGAVDLGTFSGVTISDANSVKGALQELETAHEEVDQNVNDLITLSGVAENSTDLGTFTGSVITDNTTVKNALQELESKDEAQDGIITEIDANVDDLITAVGIPENQVNLGVFTGFGAILLTATETVKSAIQKITDFLGNLRSVEEVNVSTQTVIDSVGVSDVAACKWFIVAFEEATPANREAIEVFALNDGASADFNEVSKLRLGTTGGNFLQLSVDVSGGNMRLLVDTNTTGLTVRARRVAVEDI